MVTSEVIQAYFFPTLLPLPWPVAPAWPVKRLRCAVPVPVPVPTPPFWADEMPTYPIYSVKVRHFFRRCQSEWNKKFLTPDAETPPGPALPVPAPAPLPVPFLKSQTRLRFVLCIKGTNSNKATYHRIQGIHRNLVVGSRQTDCQIDWGTVVGPRQQPREPQKSK